MNDLRVLARAKPIHKFMIVEGLKQMGRNVAVTGDGINDIKAILAAHVGLSMGSGCSAIRETSDVILVHDDFEATVKSIMWGRNIYNNIARFLQF
jgi:Ca2+-transporting ATPase